MRKKILLSAALIAVSLTSFAQVGVGTNSPEGALDVVSTDNGFLMPRMADEAAVTTPVEGMQVYNTTTDKVMLYDGTEWVVANTSAKWVDDANGDVVLDFPLALDSIKIKANGGFDRIAKDLTQTDIEALNAGDFLPAKSNGINKISSSSGYIRAANGQTFKQSFNYTTIADGLDTGTNQIRNISLQFLDEASNTNVYNGIANTEIITKPQNISVTSLTGIQSTTYPGVNSNVERLTGYTNFVYDYSSDVTSQLYALNLRLRRYDGDANTMFLSRGGLGIFGAGTIGSAGGYRVDFSTDAAATGSINNLYGFLLTTNNINAATTVNNSYGLYLEDIDYATNNYAIYTNQGKVRFGDDVETTGTLKVGGLVEYADNAAATTAGLTAGDFYRTADGTVKVVF